MKGSNGGGGDTRGGGTDINKGVNKRSGRFKLTLGRKLTQLHRWNAWLVVLLTLSGIVLFIGAIRGELGQMRVLIKQLHIFLGVVSLLLLLLYLPMLHRHWKQLRSKRGQKTNLALVLLLLIGWGVSGIVLWQLRHFPPQWNNAALVIHDLLTWVGVPYAVYHSISRSRWVKKADKRTITAKSLAPPAVTAAGTTSIAPAHNGKDRAAMTERPTAAELDPPFISRRTFIRSAAAVLLLIGVGPYFYRWLKRTFDTGGAPIEQLTGEEPLMTPAPTPLPDSVKPIGGGLSGNFRIYTVTELPKFTSKNWTFNIKGLVDKPESWNWEQFLSIPRKVQISDFHCVTGWSVYHITWEGVPLSELLERAGVQPWANYVKFYSGDGVYTDALSLKQAQMEDVLVAVLMDGKPIPQSLGGPVRLIVPNMYAYKSVKWLNSVELVGKSHLGYWEVRGYDNDAWVDKNGLGTL